MGDALTVDRAAQADRSDCARGVRVVMVMSQCFSGGFAYLPRSATGRRRGNVCGYFSSTADRMAYGCYPENRGRDNVGHSFQLFEALATSPDLAVAHREALVTDVTPDVPIRTSDVYLDELLDRPPGAPSASGRRSSTSCSGEAWRDKARWEPDIRLLDRIGQAYGLFSPRSLAELDAQAKALPATNETLQTYSEAWRATLSDLTRANLDRFVEARPAWKDRLDAKELEHLTPEAAGSMRGDLLSELAPWTRRGDDERAYGGRSGGGVRGRVRARCQGKQPAQHHSDPGAAAPRPESDRDWHTTPPYVILTPKARRRSAGPDVSYDRDRARGTPDLAAVPRYTGGSRPAR